DLEQGFARVRCPDCHHEYLLAFSCRGRWFCPSCHSKKVVQFGSHLQDNVLFPVPHRQYVFSIPKIIRRYFLYDRKLLGKLSQCAASCLTSFFRITLGKNLGIPGIALAIQTFGDYAKWHPHVHALVADGLFTETGFFLCDAEGCYSASCRTFPCFGLEDAERRRAS
ncbi:MAG: transposase zinc-binding domain-containing protein, partial [Proteobacteria bacterium]|nr:transposase zinc-binding domain-containing protein [Pseudomonadota bacterium]